MMCYDRFIRPIVLYDKNVNGIYFGTSFKVLCEEPKAFAFFTRLLHIVGFNGKQQYSGMETPVSGKRPSGGPQ